MASGITFEIKGLRELQKKFEKAPVNLVNEISGEIETSCEAIITRAKQDARKDSGTMARLTNFTGVKLSYVIFSRAKYSPYQEFGTGNKVNVPAEVSGYAQQFKGRGKRVISITPKPFLFNNFFLERPRLLANIQEVVKRLIK